MSGCIMVKVREKILKCDHVDCGNTEKVWLPYVLRERPIVLKSHPYCIQCGMVKNIGSDRAKGTGYFINALSHMDKHLKIIKKYYNLPDRTIQQFLQVVSELNW